jgi:uncharacterized protein (TIGR02145 family)
MDDGEFEDQYSRIILLRRQNRRLRPIWTLYTWTSAMEGCKVLGEGWSLPTNEEWQHMASSFGGVRDDSKDSGRTAYDALMDGGKCAVQCLVWRKQGSR